MGCTSALICSVGLAVFVEASKDNHSRICSRLASGRSANCTPAPLSNSRVQTIFPGASKESPRALPFRGIGMQPMA